MTFKRLFTREVDLGSVLNVLKALVSSQEKVPAERPPENYIETHNNFWFGNVEPSDYNEKDLFLID